MLLKKSKASLRFGLILPFVAILLFGCISPPATQLAQPSPPPVTEFSTPKTTNISEPTLTIEVIKQPTSTFQPTSTVTLLPTVTMTVSTTQTATAVLTFGIGSTKVSPVDGMVQEYVPAGEFLMGSSKNDGQAYKTEKPQHTIYLDAYWIDQTDVTNAQYARCATEGKCTPSYADPPFANYPVILVDWNDAHAYCSWAGRRLPSEAEWEKATRGTDGRIYPWGNAAPDLSKLNYNQNKGDTTEVGSYRFGASPYGALDMAGNVWEWVNDWYSDSYYQQSPARNPTGPATGTYRVLRGGAWDSNGRFVRSANRNWKHPDGNTNIGFRCAASP